MILNGFAGSPNTWKVRSLADHIGTPFEFRQVNAAVREQRQPPYLALNPTGRTPVLVDGDFKLWESNAIMQYLANKAGSSLWPSSPRDQADVLRWQSWQVAHWSKACEPLLFERVVKAMFGMGVPNEAVITAARDVFATEGRVLDAHLARHEHLAAGRLTIADFSVASYFLHADAAGMPVATYPHMDRWRKAIMALPCWKNSAPTHA